MSSRGGAGAARGRHGQGARGSGGEASASSAKVAPGRPSVFERLGTKQQTSGNAKAPQKTSSQKKVRVGDAVEALYSANSRKWKPAVVTEVELPGNAFLGSPEGSVTLRFQGYDDVTTIPLERVRKAASAPYAGGLVETA